MSAITLTEENFDKEVRQSPLPVLVSYHSSNNGNGNDSVDSVSRHLNGVLKCCKINVGTVPSLAKKYRVHSVPTIQLFQEGRVTDTIVGTMRTEQLMRILQ